MQLNKQLPLSVQLKVDATFQNFYPGQNGQIFNVLLKMSEKRGPSFVYLYGKEGFGKSHLLQAITGQSVLNNHSSVYIPMDSIAHLKPAIFQGLEKLDLVCIDDIDKIAGNQVWEEAFFHCYNLLKDNHTKLVVASHTSPKLIPLQLPDLKSRLACGEAYSLYELSDEDKLKTLQLRAFNRGLQLNKSVGNFLLTRCSRNMAELFSTLELLDEASLAHKRALTVPFVKEVLNV